MNYSNKLQKAVTKPTVWQGRVLGINTASFILLVVIFVSGIALRFYGLQWGLPYRFHVDEHQYVVDQTISYFERIIYEGDLNPHMSTYGPLPMYALIVGRLLVLIPQALWQGIPITADYLSAEHSRLSYTIGRSISAILSSATILLVFTLGRRLYSGRIALLSAALLATTVALIQAAHYFTVDSMFVFFVSLAFLQAVNILQHGTQRTYALAGLCLALALAVKLPALFLIPVILTAHLFNRANPVWRGRFDGGVISHFFDRRLLLLVTVALVCFALFSPYSFIDFASMYLEGGNLNAAHNVKDAFLEPFQTWTLAYYGLVPYLYELWPLLPYSLGLLTEVAAILGVAIALRRFSLSDRLLLSWIIPFFLVIGLNRIKTVRYILPLIPFLALSAAMGVDAVIRWLRACHRPAWIAGLVIVIVVGANVAYSIAFTRLYGERDSRMQASDWLYSTAPPGSTIVVEDELAYTAPLGLVDENIYARSQAVVEPGYELEPIYDVRLMFAPYYTLYESLGTEARMAAIRSTLEGADYVVVSERHYQPYAHLPAYRPVEFRYYQDLFGGRLGFKLVAVFDPNPHLFGIKLNDDQAELFSKAFDHPKIWIFERDLH